MRTLNHLFFPVLLALAACNGGTTSVSVNSDNSAPGSGQGSSVSGSVTGTRVANGTEVSFDASPQIVEISQRYLDGTPGVCSGVVIAPGTVLTAAHCFPKEAISNVIVSNGLSYPIDEILVHPGFYSSPEVSAFFNDVAILKSKTLPAPPLAILQSIAISPDTEISVFGFGLDENKGFGVLKNGLLKIALVTDNHLFSEPYDGENVGACQGDSGGPAILGFTDAADVFHVGVVGIVSSGTGEDCSSGDSTLFVNLQNKDVAAFIAQAAPDAVFN